jgi:biopolymer transport protein ExbD
MGASGLDIGGEGDEHGSDGVVAEINITPLTDIFLVLLIIFMVTTSVIDNESKQIKLPGAEVSSETPSGVSVAVNAQGDISVNDTPVSDENLESVLREAVAQAESKVVILRGDRELFLGKAVHILDVAQQVGAESIALATSTPDVAYEPSSEPTLVPAK